MVEVSRGLVNECWGLVYDQWAKAYDNHKQVKAERDDGSEDWQDFHNERLRRAQVELERWKGLLAEITPLHTIGR